MRGPYQSLTRDMDPEEREKWFRAQGRASTIANAGKKSHEITYVNAGSHCSHYTGQVGQRSPKQEKRTTWYHQASLSAYNEWTI